MARRVNVHDVHNDVMEYIIFVGNLYDNKYKLICVGVVEINSTNNLINIKIKPAQILTSNKKLD